MPSFIAGPIKITSVSAGATVLFGDTAFVAPKNASKSYSGGGGGVTGDLSATYSLLSNTNTIDPDLVDTNNNTGT
ncbi:spore germination protein [Effusibacillus dendaii]|uniref:Spore germination protein n=1 Tax=Effusibacillus dendaii TaxID=2743772 RepID=A0A7I8DDI7_9BACL|nr:spore germination protein [Effusibacillus dendaii]BCJ88087.1 hypothetical protein skT53_30720 [Effusibacillus dendaii]